MKTFRVQIWREMSVADVDVDCDVSASSAIDAAAMALGGDGGGLAERIRVEERNGDAQALLLLNVTYQDAGLPDIHFHDLRHSAATILLCMGVNIKVIQELLGHSYISITLRVYGHLLPSMQQAVVDTWDGVFKDDEVDTNKGGKKGRKKRQ